MGMSRRDDDRRLVVALTLRAVLVGAGEPDNLVTVAGALGLPAGCLQGLRPYAEARRSGVKVRNEIRR